MSILIKILDHFVISHSKSSETFKGTAQKLTADGPEERVDKERKRLNEVGNRQKKKSLSRNIPTQWTEFIFR